MSDVRSYFAVESLPNGRALVVRAFKPEDRADFIAAASRTGPLTRYRRFFTLKNEFSDREKDFFLNVDFDKHVALVALTDEAGHQVIVGAARYVALQPGSAEVAFTVIDQYQKQGIGPILLRHLATVARSAGLKTLVAEVLTENQQMLRVFERSGLPIQTTQDHPEVVHVVLQLS
jgi:ribosomal protein S18 acetylase RimI-like enzyme